jgi:PEP-CTERM motif-containing protein
VKTQRALAAVVGSLFLTLGLTLGLAGTAQATLIPTLGSVSPSGGNFLWSYDVSLALDQNATGGPVQSVNPVPVSSGTGDFLTIYDFRGFVSGSCFAPTGWTCQTQAVGFTPDTQIPSDDPALTNLTFTRTGATLPGPVLDLGDFGAQSLGSSLDVGRFTSRGTRNLGVLVGTKIDSVGDISVPAAVPEPATLLLLGSTMAGLGALLRRRREQR